MTDKMILDAMRERGFNFRDAQGLIPKDYIARARLARDAAMITAPNSGVPLLFTSYVDPMVVEILTAPRNAKKLFGEVKKGDWTTNVAVFKTIELTGEITPYADFQRGAMSDVNINFPERRNCRFQTHIRYGSLETEMNAEAMVNLASEKQRSAANTIDVQANRFYLYGVAGQEIYGLLNEPNLPTTLTPASINGVTLWAGKDTVQIYNDIVTIFTTLMGRSRGLIDATSNLVLAVSPETYGYLSKATDFNISVMRMIKDNYPSMEIVVIPELAAASGNVVMMFARSINGQPTAQLAFSEKMRAFPLIQYESWYQQKFGFGTYGAIIYHPYAIQTMTGV